MGCSLDYCIIFPPDSGYLTLGSCLSLLPVIWLCYSWYTVPLWLSFLGAISVFPDWVRMWCSARMKAPQGEGISLFSSILCLQCLYQCLGGDRLSINKYTLIEIYFLLSLSFCFPQFSHLWIAMSNLFHLLLNLYYLWGNRGTWTKSPLSYSSCTSTSQLLAYGHTLHDINKDVNMVRCYHPLDCVAIGT